MKLFEETLRIYIQGGPKFTLPLCKLYIKLSIKYHIFSYQLRLLHFRNKNKDFLDDFDFVYFGDGGASKYGGGGEKKDSEGGTSQSYSTSKSYSSGGSGSKYH